MRFLVDAQLPAALARWIASRGHEAEHVSDKQMSDASDSAIWDYAFSVSAVIITKDEDFARRRSLVRSGPTIVWIRIGNTRTKRLIEWSQLACRSVSEAVERGETLIELV